ncbi:MAG: dTDP-4-dehydrorhamnose 3,5-epimerase family protein [Acidimicrobiales bacterium]
MPKVTQSDEIAGVAVVSLDAYPDERGRFVETYRRSWFEGTAEMVQSSRSDKAAGSLVGIHYHLGQADYWYVMSGLAQVVLHDLRSGSPTEGATMSLELGPASAEGGERAVLVPAGVGHGFAALSDMTLTYMVDSYYDGSDEYGVAWDDPDVAAPWALSSPVVSARDASNPRRAELSPAELPRWRG